MASLVELPAAISAEESSGSDTPSTWPGSKRQNVEEWAASEFSTPIFQLISIESPTNEKIDLLNCDRRPAGSYRDIRFHAR
jgi:hypothetical protein